jgi:uncharacterized protein YkwD
LAAVTAALSLLSVASAPAQAACRGAGTTIAGKVSKRAARATLCLVNAQRAAHGLRRLRVNARLKRAGRSFARDLARHRYFSHVSRSGSTPTARIRRAGYRRTFVGENLAWGVPSGSSPRAIVAGWMRSPGHRANILHRAYRHFGVGIVARTPDGRRGATYAAEFGG